MNTTTQERKFQEHCKSHAMNEDDRCNPSTTQTQKRISIVEFDEEAIKESMKYFSKDEYEQNTCNKILAQILEVVREHSNKGRQSDFQAIRQIVRMFPE